ncbi:MAG: type II secretion system minor pseudopilin GspK [Rudaea sp.]
MNGQRGSPKSRMQRPRVGDARRQRGVALIIALLVVALAVVLIAGLLDRGELAVARVRNQLREAQAQAYSQGLEAYAARVLAQASASDNEVDSNDSPWAVPLPPTSVPGGKIVASMRDRNGCFNLNNLIDASGAPSDIWGPKFRRLLRALNVDETLAEGIVSWMRSGTSPDDNYYLQQEVPYRPAKRAFVHVSELRLVKGITPEVYARLAKDVCVLPRGTPININTASAAVLITLSSIVDLQTAKGLAQDGRAQYASIDEIRAKLPGQLIECGGPEIPVSQCYDVKSSYFLARGDVILDELPFTFFSLIERRSSGGSSAGIRVIERSRGTDF